MLKAGLRDSIIYGFASILSKGLAIFLLPIYTRVLAPSDFGAYDLLLTLAALANLVVALEISQGLARYWGDTDSWTEKRKLASTTLWFTALMYGVFLAIGLVWAVPLNQWIIGDERYLLAYRIAIVFIAINGIYLLLLNQLRWELRSKTYAVASLSYALMTLVLSAILCLWMDMGLTGIILSQAISALITSFFCWQLLKETLGFTFDYTKLRTMISFSAPLVPAGLAVFISLYVNRYALLHFASLADIGIFSIGSRIAGISMLFIGGIQMALTPLIYQHYKQIETPIQIARLFNWFLALAFMGCLFLSLFSKELLFLFTTSEYELSSTLIIYLAPAFLLSQMYIFAPGIAIRKKTNIQLYVMLLSAFVSIAANWILVPIWGVLGAALATLIASLIFFSVWVYVSQSLYKIPYHWKSILLATCAFIICTALGVLLGAEKFSIVFTLVLKCALIAIFLFSIISCALLPISDLINLSKYLNKRFFGKMIDPKY
jgi:O-antigen/teichoic acid export membrane protein